MNDEQFEDEQIGRDNAGKVERDNLRESLARVEAYLECARGDLKQQERMYWDAKAKMAEAVGLLSELRACSSNDNWPVLVETDAFLARHALAERQEAQGAQAGDERAAFERKVQDLAERFQPDYRRYGDAGEYKDATLEWAWNLWMARAALATQPAAEPVEIEVPTFGHEGMGCGLEDRGITDRYEAMEYGYNEALEQQWEIINSHGPLFAAPPAAAHGDEAVRNDAERYRWLRRKVAIVGAERKSVFHILNLEPRYIAPNPSIEFDAAIDAAMHAQAGEGGE